VLFAGFRAQDVPRLCAIQFSNDGKIENIAQVLISKDGPVVMLTASPVTIRAGAVCSALKAEDVRSAGFIVAGQPASDQIADQIRKQITPAMSKDFGKEVCESYVPADSGFTTKITVAGTAHPEMTEKVIWVSLNEGYAVAP